MKCSYGKRLLFHPSLCHSLDLSTNNHRRCHILSPLEYTFLIHGIESIHWDKWHWCSPKAHPHHRLIVYRERDWIFVNYELRTTVGFFIAAMNDGQTFAITTKFDFGTWIWVLSYIARKVSHSFKAVYVMPLTRAFVRIRPFTEMFTHARIFIFTKWTILLVITQLTGCDTLRTTRTTECRRILAQHI